MLTIKGIYTSPGKIELNNLKMIDWKDLSEEKPPELPFGSRIDLTISFEAGDFLSGKYGIVWASYDSRQVDIIQSALLAQQINSELKKISLNGHELIMIKIPNETEINIAMDFIWRTSTGLRLKPDWSYPEGETNKSFQQWLNGQ
jgi:hypothetical protein